MHSKLLAQNTSFTGKGYTVIDRQTSLFTKKQTFGNTWYMHFIKTCPTSLSMNLNKSYTNSVSELFLFRLIFLKMETYFSSYFYWFLHFNSAMLLINVIIYRTNDTWNTQWFSDEIFSLVHIYLNDAVFLYPSIFTILFILLYVFVCWRMY